MAIKFTTQDLLEELANQRPPLRKEGEGVTIKEVSEFLHITDVSAGRLMNKKVEAGEYKMVIMRDNKNHLINVYMRI